MQELWLARVAGHDGRLARAGAEFGSARECAAGSFEAGARVSAPGRVGVGGGPLASLAPFFSGRPVSWIKVRCRALPTLTESKHSCASWGPATI